MHFINEGEKYYVYFIAGFSIAALGTSFVIPDLWIFTFSFVTALFLLVFYHHQSLISAQKLNAQLVLNDQLKIGEIEYQFFHDRVTGLKNTQALKEDIKQEFSAILLIDIDKFNYFNELYGLESGDEVIKSFAHFVAKFAEKNDYEAYRIYADGFILRSQKMLLGHEEVYHDIHAFLDALSSYRVLLDLEDTVVDLQIDVTIAVSMEKEDAMEKANTALKYAKAERKHFLAYYQGINPKIELRETLYWQNEIKSALQTERIIPVYQPIVDKEGNTIKYEVLTRLKKVDEQGHISLISPSVFLDIALKTKLYTLITRSMIAKSFQMMQDKQIDFSINLLFDDIKNHETMQYLKEQIVHYGVGKRLVLEIVESEDIKDYELLKKEIDRFRALGVRIAIDDFGSGFSNYAYILNIAPDYLKIDGSLIKAIDTDTNACKLVRSIHTLAKQLGLKTIAEYVHSEAVFEVTKAIGIDEFQGYYFSAPLPHEELFSTDRALKFAKIASI